MSCSPKWAIVFCVALALCTAPRETLAAERVVVSAAASLRDVLHAIGQSYQRQHADVDLAFNFASSGQLMAQIELGAPVDIFVSADLNDVLRLKRKGLVVADAVFARNALIVAVSLTTKVSINGIDDLARNGVRLITTGKQAPLAAYTRSFLQKAEASGTYGLGFEKKVISNIVSEEQEARTLSAKLAMGEGDVAIVYITDLTDDVKAKVKTISIPTELNVTPEYGVGLISSSARNRRSREFYQFLVSEESGAFLRQHGFTSP